MANLSAIKLPNGTTYNLKDNGALQLTGGSVTGPVSFGDSVSIDEATVGDLVVNGSASFTNNLQANTINGVAVGSSPKFTDTTYSSLAAASGGTAVSLVTTGEKYRWNSKTSNTGTITSVKTTAGAHTAINVSSGAVTFNVPTKTSHLTNDSNFITLNNIESTSIPTADIIAEFDSAAHMSSTDMTTSEVSDFVNSLNVGGGDEIINLFYPVGSYYETEDGTFNPNVAWGGTWALESTAKQPTGESARISGRNTVNVTTTSSITVLTLQFTSKTGRVYVHADCAFFTSRYTSVINLKIDGVQFGYSTTNSTTLQRGVVEGITDVEIGAHTATVVLTSQDSGTTATLPPYNTYTLFVMDVANPNGGVYKWHRTA